MVKVIWSNLLNHGDTMLYLIYILYIIHYISMVESNKFDDIYSKIWNILLWPNFLEIRACSNWKEHVITSFRKSKKKITANSTNPYFIIVKFWTCFVLKVTTLFLLNGFFYHLGKGMSTNFILLMMKTMKVMVKTH